MNLRNETINYPQTITAAIVIWSFLRNHETTRM